MFARLIQVHWKLDALVSLLRILPDPHKHSTIQRLAQSFSGYQLLALPFSAFYAHTCGFEAVLAHLNP